MNARRSFYQLIGAHAQLQRHRDAERAGGLRLMIISTFVA